MTTETVTEEPFDIDRMLEMILVDVCELPDRTSPEEEPDMMLVTGDELDMIVRRAFEYVNARRLASEARSSSEVERLREAALPSRASLTSEGFSGWSDHTLALLHEKLERRHDEMPDETLCTARGCVRDAMRAIELADEYVAKARRELEAAA